MERSLEAQQVLEGHMVELAAYQLTREAQHWWQRTYHLLQQGIGAEVITWEVFKEELYKYFSNSVRQAKELELLQLRQGTMTVTTYTSKFEELCHFSRAVAPLEIKSFAELVNKRRVVEDCSRRNVNVGSSRGGHHNRGGGARSFAPKGQNFKRGGAGHMSWNCPEKIDPNAGRAQQQGRVYAITADDAAKSGTLIRGKCKIGGKMLTALYDTGASHSFIAFDKAVELGLKMSALSFDLHVHTPVSKTVVTRLGCQEVPFRVENRDFVHDFICLPMPELDFILGLD
ncbi:uncharacterized protein LOC107627274 [Arachis ipaensis]|uniref:uncharacterized protein LOC107627274 n=1 Tax=Arachis ipaensis TaxID=130454 RepID=UPI0007AFB9FC|nr:uncharacterized protein LOC107627274 [Arachis ipaensis]